jgi:hypothetical protein
MMMMMMIMIMIMMMVTMMMMTMVMMMMTKCPPGPHLIEVAVVGGDDNDHDDHDDDDDDDNRPMAAAAALPGVPAGPFLQQHDPEQGRMGHEHLFRHHQETARHREEQDVEEAQAR